MPERDRNIRLEDVTIIGAGPAGAIAAALLRKKGYEVQVLEQSHFPRFSIGESLLPQCMEFIEEAGMTVAVREEGFQFKDGAVFLRGGEKNVFDFQQKFSVGPGTTYQVQRARFDQILADQAAAQGAEIHYGHRIEGIELDAGVSTLSVVTDQGERYQLCSRFVLDASGFGRVLPRLLQLDKPSDFPPRMSVFTHIKDNIYAMDYDRNKILIVVHPEHQGVWYWLIPFSNGRCSLGVVAEESFFDVAHNDEAQLLRQAIASCPDLAGLLAEAEYDTPVRSIKGYAAKVKSLWGEGFALLGNAGEFLDPVFSSGVTIAMKSASLAVPAVDRHLRGEVVDWERDYAQPLMRGVDTFRAYVSAWYAGTFQEVIFAKQQPARIREMICSILAGYAWDDNNPYVSEAARRLDALVQVCRGQ